MGSSYRTSVGFVAERVTSYVWIIVLPAAAECTANVWFPSITFGALDLQLAALNVSGALIEGFFTAFENGTAIAKGPIGDMLAWIADDFRGSFLSTYTSWAGMVGFAAALAHSSGTISSGFLYMFCCVLCGFIAHGLGHLVAATAFGSGMDARPKVAFGVSIGHHVLLGAIISYIIGYAHAHRTPPHSLPPRL